MPSEQQQQHRTEFPRDRGERSHPFTPGRLNVLLNSQLQCSFQLSLTVVVDNLTRPGI